MKTTDFASFLNRYFNHFLINERGSSPRTVETYRYAFIQLIEFFEEQKKMRPEFIEIKDINRENIVSYLSWLENIKKVSISTRNHRLAALRCFTAFLKYERPECLNAVTQIHSIKLKKHPHKEISFLNPAGMKLLLDQINRLNKVGNRDFTMIYLMYTTGIRVSELIDIRGSDISLNNPKTIIIRGKGGKIRHVPVISRTASILEQYLKANDCLKLNHLDQFIFLNHSGEKFTRQGVNFMLSKYAKIARKHDPSLIPIDCSPHKIRHSFAMALVEEGVDLIIVRDLLGHSSVTTTEMYAKVSSAKRRKAIETASKELVQHEDAIWENNTNLKDWLRGLTKNANIM